MDKDKNMWMVRAGEKGFLIDKFKKEKIVALGFNEIGDVSSLNTLEDIKEKCREIYPGKNERSIGTVSHMIYKFLHDFQKGDFVVSYEPKERLYYVGEIIGDYEYNKNLIKEGFNKIRKVNWVKEISRDDLTTSTQYSLGAAQTIFEIKDENKDELMSILEGKAKIDQHDLEPEETLETIMENTIDRSHEFIKDKIMKLDWDEMQELVAGIIRAMGYKTIITGIGSDLGKDIVASLDGLGLDGPKIKVEVKHRSSSIGAPAIRNFTGGMRQGQKGLYVSTGGFTREAYYEAERATFPLTLVDADMIVNLIVRYYDNFDVETRALIPLKKMYWPISE